MSPYRVLVSSPQCRDLMILSAKLFSNKYLQTYHIQIIQRATLGNHRDAAIYKAIAHLQSCETNSVLLDEYAVLQDRYSKHSNTYKIQHVCTGNVLDNTECSLQKCLAAAMKDYCFRKGIELFYAL